MTESPERIAACLHFCKEFPTEFLQRRQAWFASPSGIVTDGTAVNEIRNSYAGVVAVVASKMEQR